MKFRIGKSFTAAACSSFGVPLAQLASGDISGAGKAPSMPPGRYFAQRSSKLPRDLSRTLLRQLVGRQTDLYQRADESDKMGPLPK